jgi:hypothetical protein
MAPLDVAILVPSIPDCAFQYPQLTVWLLSLPGGRASS